MTDLDRAQRWNGRLDRLDTGIPADKVLSPVVAGVNCCAVLSFVLFVHVFYQRWFRGIIDLIEAEENKLCLDLKKEYTKDN